LQILKGLPLLSEEEVTLGSVEVGLRDLLVLLRLIGIGLTSALLQLREHAQHRCEAFVTLLILPLERHNQGAEEEVFHDVFLFRFLHRLLYTLKGAVQVSEFKQHTCGDVIGG
jgi:hypothetical protein